MKSWLCALIAFGLCCGAPRATWAQVFFGAAPRSVGIREIVDDELKDVLDEAIRQCTTRRLQIGVHEPAVIMQAIRAFGVGYPLLDEAGTGLLTAGDWLKAGALIRQQRCWRRIDGRFRFQVPAGMGSELRSQDVLSDLLAMRLGTAREELNEIKVEHDDQKLVFWQFGDFVTNVTQTFSTSDVASYLFSRCLTSDMTQPWKTTDEREWVVEDLVELLLRQMESGVASSSGSAVRDPEATEPKTAGRKSSDSSIKPGPRSITTLPQSRALQALALACFRYREVHDIHPSRRLVGVWARAEERLKAELEQVRPARSEDDVWSFGELDADVSVIDRLRANSRVLVWLNHAQSRKQLQFQGARMVVKQLAKDVLAEYQTADPTDVFTAAHALNVYRARTRMVSLSAAASPRRRVPVVIPPPPVPVNKDRWDLGEVSSPSGSVAGLKVAVCDVNGWVEQTLVCDERGRFRIPRSWTEDSRSSTEPRLLIVNDGGRRVGWFSLRERAWRKQQFNDDETIEEPVLIDIRLHDCDHILRGRVVNPEQAPLPGVRVQVASFWHATDLEVRTQCLSFPDASVLPTTVTDGEGRFELRVPSGVAGGVRFADRNWAMRIVGAVEFVPTDSDLGQIQLVPAGGIRGRLVDSQTKLPVAGFSLVASCPGMAWYATSDAAGQFVLEGLRPDFHELKSAAAPGTSPVILLKTMPLKVVAGQSTEVTLDVVQARRLSGRVVEALSEEPVVSARVSVTAGAWSREVRVDALGRFELFVPPQKIVAMASDSATHRLAALDSRAEIDAGREPPLQPLLLKLSETLPGLMNDVRFRVDSLTFGGRGLDDVTPRKGTDKTLFLPLELHTEDAKLLRRWKLKVHDLTTGEVMVFDRSGQLADVEFPIRLSGNAVEMQIDAAGFWPSEAATLRLENGMPVQTFVLKPKVAAEK